MRWRARRDEVEYRGLSKVRNKGGMIGMLGNGQVRMETFVQRVQRKGILRLCRKHKHEIINQHYMIFDVRFE